VDKPKKFWIRIKNWVPFLLFEKGSWSYAWRWLNSVLRSRNAFQDGIPWLHFGAIDWLDTYLQPSMRVFEWGSGGSTLYWANRVERVISVEHHREWFTDVTAAIDKDRCPGVELIHIPESPTEGLTEYAAYIEQYPDGYFDLILVDGVARPDCLQRAMPKIREGGVIILDNSERFEHELQWFASDKWPMLHFRSPTPCEKTSSFMVTTLIIKHASDKAAIAS